ncbi:MAG: Gfo/Idh/MocA family protein, partial [Pirellulaceae bacterium]
AASTQPVLAPLAGATSSERVRVGLIGVGIRGYELHRDIRQSPHAHVGGIADLSDHYVERIRPELADPRTTIHRDYRALLDDKSIDAVVIAAPDHWHAQMTLDALDAGKDVYVEKPLSYSLEEANQVRAKALSTGRVTQVGYQRRNVSHFYQARELVQSGLLGEITHIQLWSSRNRPTPPWRTYDNYNKGGLPPKSGAEHVDWERFQANRKSCPYDPRRFFHWQCYEEYSTGIFGILMSHYLDVANLVMDLDIPATCAATGGIYQYDDGRTVPDTCSALFNYPARRLTISFVGVSNNAFHDEIGQYRGTSGTLEFRDAAISVYAEAKNKLFEKFVPADSAKKYTNLRAQSVHELRPQGAPATRAHLDDFFMSVQERRRCRCPIEEAYKAMVGVAMAIESYKTQRTVHWDVAQRQIKAV